MQKGKGTKAVHAGVKPCEATGAIMTPIYQTSTYVQEGVGNHKGYEYSRTLNPTRHALEQALAELEGAKHGLVFGSGLAAMDNLIKILKPGDEVISTDDLYGGSYRLFTTIFENYGIKFHFIDLSNPEVLKSSVNENTRMIWIETPTNPMMKITDIKAVSEAVSGNNILVCVDNTFATPMIQLPLYEGADVVMHSATKYLGGHSDVVMGCLMLNNDDLDERLRTLQNSCGAIAGPMDSFLVLRGIKTLHLRMQRHCENGRAIADFLSNHSKVEKVYWPGLESHPGHRVAKKQMSEFGGMISFIIKGDDTASAHRLVESVEIFTLAESLGGVESLIGHPATMTHASIPKEVREKVGVTDGLIRLSLGVEDAEDLIDDLRQAFDKV
jgi:cystathionine beta-lyase/cystathionine gamma-synthase